MKNIETEEKITIKATCALDMVDLVEVRGRFTCLHNLIYSVLKAFENSIVRITKIVFLQRGCRPGILVQGQIRIYQYFACPNVIGLSHQF